MTNFIKLWHKAVFAILRLKITLFNDGVNAPFRLAKNQTLVLPIDSLTTEWEVEDARAMAYLRKRGMATALTISNRQTYLA